MNAKPIRDLFLFVGIRPMLAHAAQVHAQRAEEAARKGCNQATTRIIRRK